MLGSPVETLTDSVKVGKQTFHFRGSSDANIMAGTLLLPEAEVNLKALHWKRLYGSDFDPRLVKHILVVTATIQPQEGEEPYDESEIAEFASKHGADFLRMIASAYKVIGIAGDANTFDQVAAGNFEGHQDSSSNSTSGASMDVASHAEGS